MPPANDPAQHHHRTLTFCTPVVDTGGSIDAPMGLSCHSQLLYTAAAAAPDTTAGALAQTLPVAWTGKLKDKSKV